MSKRLKILVIALALCICGIACLCSFTPLRPSWSAYVLTSFTETDIENLMAIAEFQWEYGSLNAFLPVACHVKNGYIRLYCVPSEYGWNVAVDGNNFTVTSANSTGYLMRTTFSRNGFALLYTDSSGTGSDLLFYRTQEGEFVKNPNYTFATGNDNDVIADCAAEWYETWKVVSGYETAIEEAESEGYANGYGEGESDGFANGYTSGYNQGQFDGLGQGFDLGYADGITDGYESGYDRGYADGYIDGYDTGAAGGGGGGEPPVIEPSFELDIPEIFDGMANAVTGILSAFDIEIFGINVVGLLIAILVIAIVAFVIRKLVK